MKLLVSGLAAALAVVVTTGCGGGGMGSTAMAPAGAVTPGMTTTASQTTFALSSGVASTHQLPPAGGFGGSVTLPAATAPAGATMTVEASTSPPDGVTASQAALRKPSDVGGLSILFFVTFRPSVTIAFNGFPSFAVTVPPAKNAAGQFFLALSGPAVAGVSQQFRTLGPAGVDATTLRFTGFTDTLTLQAGTRYTFALYAVEEETRPAGAFYALYGGERRAALDAIQATGEYTAAVDTFTFAALMAGPIVTGQDNYYVWGVDRGGATFAPFPQEPNVKFNAVVVVEAQAEGGVNASVVLIPGATTPLQASAVHIDGAKITVSIPAALLPSTGSGPAGYRWNLWPRDEVGGPPSQVAKFIPENALAAFLPGAEGAAPGATP
jgi:hypothetical protein